MNTSAVLDEDRSGCVELGQNGSIKGGVAAGLLLGSLNAKAKVYLKSDSNIIEEKLIVQDYFNEDALIHYLLVENQQNKSTNYISDSIEWVGYVSEIDSINEKFSAKLFDKSDHSTYEMATFNFKDVSPEDIPLLQLGSFFYWYVGYANIRGQVSKQSVIRFQRLPQISEQEFNDIQDNCNRLFNELNWV